MSLEYELSSVFFGFTKELISHLPIEIDLFIQFNRHTNHSPYILILLNVVKHSEIKSLFPHAIPLSNDYLTGKIKMQKRI